MITRRPAKVERWFVDEPFNPASPIQIRKLMAAMGQTSRPSKHSKTGLPSTDRQTLERLASRYQVFADIQKWREVQKIDSTYATGLEAHTDDNGRIHASFTHRPYTMRLSCVNPNLQNIPGDDDKTSFAHRFRKCIVAAPGCKLISADYAGIEAVQAGWFSSDKDYYRLAKAGIHSYLVSHWLKKPVDLSMSDIDLGEALGEIKARYHDKDIYKKLKKVVHRVNYGSSAYAMYMDDTKTFASIDEAEGLMQFYFSLCPKLEQWHKQVRTLAHAQGFLGGNDHPYKFKSWFWDVMHWDSRLGKLVRGADWNKVIAYYPQSTAAGNLYDAVLDMTNPGLDTYVGDLYYGRTPIRALIHDEILAEVPNDKVAEYIAKAYTVMSAPIQCQPLPKAWGMGPYMVHSVEIKMGQNWAEMEKVDGLGSRAS